MALKFLLSLQHPLHLMITLLIEVFRQATIFNVKQKEVVIIFTPLITI